MWDLPGFTRLIDIGEIVRAFGYLVGGFMVGWLLYRVVLARLRGRAERSDAATDDIVVGIVHDVSLVWLTAAGAYFALRSLPLTSGVRDGTSRAMLAVLIASFTWVAARASADAVRLFAARTEGVTRGSSIFVNLARLTVFAIGALILLQALGVSITPLLTALGVGGLAVALALQDTLSNLFAGLQILAAKKVRPGDYVQLDSGHEGYVVDINWRNTTLRQLPNNILLVPNARLAESIVTNYYYPDREMSVIVQVGVAYGSDLENVERITIDVARACQRDVEGGVGSFEPLVRYHTFADSSINFSVIMRVDEFAQKYPLKHEFVKRLKARYDTEGISIPFPIRTLDVPEGLPVHLGRSADPQGPA